jgi:hypothetical protein
MANKRNGTAANKGFTFQRTRMLELMMSDRYNDNDKFTEEQEEDITVELSEEKFQCKDLYQLKYHSSLDAKTLQLTDEGLIKVLIDENNLNNSIRKIYFEQSFENMPKTTVSINIKYLKKMNDNLKTKYIINILDNNLIIENKSLDEIENILNNQVYSELKNMCDNYISNLPTQQKYKDRLTKQSERCKAFVNRCLNSEDSQLIIKLINSLVFVDGQTYFTTVEDTLKLIKENTEINAKINSTKNISKIILTNKLIIYSLFTHKLINKLFSEKRSITRKELIRELILNMDDIDKANEDIKDSFINCLINIPDFDVDIQKKYCDDLCVEILKTYNMTDMTSRLMKRKDITLKNRCVIIKKLLMCSIHILNYDIFDDKQLLVLIRYINNIKFKKEKDYVGLTKINKKLPIINTKK